MKPKLLIATDNFEPRWDGITRFLTEVIPYLTTSYEVTVLAPDFKGKRRPIRGVKVKRIPVFPFMIGDFSPAKVGVKASKLIRKEIVKHDLVWTQTIGPIGSTAIRVAYSYKKPLVAFVHSIEWDLINHAMSKANILRLPARMIARWWARFLYNKCNHIIVPSHEVMGRLEIHKIWPKKTIAHLGTNTQRFTPEANKAKAKKDIDINPQKKVIGYCGRIAREKDIKTLLRAFLRLKAKRNDVVLLLVGEGVKDFDSIIKDHKEIISVGKQSNVVPYLQAMDVHVLPSLLETSSLSTMEAMACGIPVICTSVGLVRTYVKEKQNGMLFRRRNSFVLSMKLNWLLSEHEKRIEMGLNARNTMIKHFDWQSTVSKIHSVLDLLWSRYGQQR